ncbi:SGNH/GDSL hydrolase family protein [Xanthobacter versatilis]|uniref:SGNH/GDSL hydrolase family protein n=1 Tax=Xanthobacter autotrophicus (strain ATCC BAA-1158 / Py2) TaxID=78245 RepID=UPI0037291DAA
MAFNPLALLSRSIGCALEPGGRSLRDWRYATRDTAAAVLAPGYFVGDGIGIGDTITASVGIGGAVDCLQLAVVGTSPIRVATRTAYNPGTMVLAGDSRFAQFFNDPSAKLRRFAGNFITQALRMSGQRMRVEKSFAVSGQRSDQYLSAQNVADILACKSQWLMIYGVANDIGQLSNTVDHFTVNIKPVADAWTATGRSVILITETGNNAYTTAEARGAVFKYNRQVRDYCRVNRGAILFDAAAIVMDPSQPMTLNPAYSGDGLHINLVAGGYALGKAFAALIKQLAPPCDGLVYSGGQVFANGGMQLFSNPLWLTTNGGTGSGVMTGTVPAGITGVSAPAGSSIVGSVSAGPMATTSSSPSRPERRVSSRSSATSSPRWRSWARAITPTVNGTSPPVRATSSPPGCGWR